ncbi:hypothetical protein JCM21900_005969 [Sporobolomyces salmonicolor]
MPASSTPNGLVSVPKSELSPGFEYQPAFDDLIGQIASTNAVDADWRILRDMLKHKLAEAIASFLSIGPQGPLSPEDAYHARLRAYETLDSFSGPPFTIQRLCELSLYPRKQYTSLPKYLRALTRVLSVTSERSAFTEDDAFDPLASTSATTLDSSLGVVHEGVVMSPAHHTHRRPTTPIPSSPLSSAASAASPRASPQVVPLLSPIPWLTAKSDEADSSIDDLAPLSPSHSPVATKRPPNGTVSSSLPSAAAPGSGTDPQISPLKALAHSDTATPTGGLVDEVDPGSGGQETADPVALSSATTLSPPKGLAPADLLDSPKSSLHARFVRASSPRVELPEEGEGEDKDAGMGGDEGS